MGEILLEQGGEELFELVELDRTAAIRARAGESEARRKLAARMRDRPPALARELLRSEEHTSELQSQSNLVCRLLLEKKKQDPPVCKGRAREAALARRSPTA